MANNENLKPFQKGQSGNPKGKEPGTISLGVLINRLLDGTTTIEEAGEKLKISKREAIWLEVVKDALDKKAEPITRHRAVSMLADRTDGKPKQAIEHSSDITLEEASEATKEKMDAILKALGK